MLRIGWLQFASDIKSQLRASEQMGFFGLRPALKFRERLGCPRYCHAPCRIDVSESIPTIFSPADNGMAGGVWSRTSHLLVSPTNRFDFEPVEIDREGPIERHRVFRPGARRPCGTTTLVNGCVEECLDALMIGSREADV
jgi:hypothetical protein